MFENSRQSPRAAQLSQRDFGQRRVFAASRAPGAQFRLRFLRNLRLRGFWSTPCTEGWV